MSKPVYISYVPIFHQRSCHYDLKLRLEGCKKSKPGSQEKIRVENGEKNHQNLGKLVSKEMELKSLTEVEPVTSQLEYRVCFNYQGVDFIGRADYVELIEDRVTKLEEWKFSSQPRVKDSYKDQARIYCFGILEEQGSEELPYSIRVWDNELDLDAFTLEHLLGEAPNGSKPKCGQDLVYNHKRQAPYVRRQLDPIIEVLSSSRDFAAPGDDCFFCKYKDCKYRGNVDG